MIPILLVLQSESLSSKHAKLHTYTVAVAMKIIHCAHSSLFSDGVSRLGLGLEGLRSQSRALCLETLHRLFFMKFCKKEIL